VNPDIKYELAFSIRTKDLVTGGLPVVHIFEALPNGGSKAVVESEPITSNISQRMSMQFTGSGSGAIRFALTRLQCKSSSCPAFGTLWLDDFDLKKL
jgi:hypothetical protein